MKTNISLIPVIALAVSECIVPTGRAEQHPFVVDWEHYTDVDLPNGVLPFDVETEQIFEFTAIDWTVPPPALTFTFAQDADMPQLGSVVTTSGLEISTRGDGIRTFHDEGVLYPTTVGETFSGYPDATWTSSGDWINPLSNSGFVGLRYTDGVDAWYGYAYILSIVIPGEPGRHGLWISEYGWNTTPNTPGRVNDSGANDPVSPPPIPEPSSALLMTLTACGIILRRRR